MTGGWVLFQAAAVQLNSTSDEYANWEQADALIREASALGARFVCTPENTPFLGPHEEKVNRAESLNGPTCSRFSALARELEIHLLLGSFAELSGEPTRCFNTSVLFGPDGSRIAAYRKIHLFDVTIEANNESYTESETLVPGEDIVVVDTPFGRLGMAVCYDLGFPELVRAMVEQGMEICAVPSAFTSLTGRVHWESLLRSRAIENLTFMIAADQGGYHVGGRETHGDSMIVDPWGQVLNRLPHGTGVVVANVDIDKLVHTRKMFPALEHKRFACARLS